MHFKNLWNNFAERIKYLAVWELNHHVRIIADSLDFNSMFKNIYFSTNKKNEEVIVLKTLKIFHPCFGSSGSLMVSSRGLMRAPMTQAFRHIPANMTFAPFQPKVSELSQTT